MAGFDDLSADDWTTGQFDGAGGATQVEDALDFVIPSFTAATDVDQTEREAEDSKFAAPPPGSYLFEVTGFLKRPEKTSKTLFVGSRAEACSPYKVALKLRVVGQGNLSMLDNIELPPSDPKEVMVWQNGTKAPNGDRRFAGFMAKKFEHLIKRIGFPFAVGDPIPAEALSLRNWVGRKVYANVVNGKPQIDPVTNQPKVDPATGLPYPPRPQVELFSYRESEDTAVAAAHGSKAGQDASAGHGSKAGQPTQPPQGRPQATQARPAAAGAGADRFVAAGLNNV